MRYHFQTMNIIRISEHPEPGEALKEFNENRRANQQEEYKILGYVDRLYIPSTELSPGDQEFLDRTSGEDFQYDGISAYYDTPQELQACLKLLSYAYCIKFYEVVVHEKFTIFVRKEHQLVEDVKRFVNVALSLEG
jgi:hypothetical protein